MSSRIIVGICVLTLLSTVFVRHLSAHERQKQQATIQKNEQSAPSPTSTKVIEDKTEGELLDDGGSETKSPTESQTIQKRNFFDRWFAVDTFTLGFRVRNIKDSQGVLTINQFQFKLDFKGRLKFDRADKYGIHVDISSGDNFGGGWNPTGIGTGLFTPDLNIKNLYLSAKPNKRAAFLIGGLPLGKQCGLSTEITCHDDDAFMEGTRGSFIWPERLYFDKVDIIGGYIGDFQQPNVFKRLSRLNNFNFIQITGTKRISDRASFSVSYASEAGVQILRQAMEVKDLLCLADSFRLEAYQRLDHKPDAGFAATIKKDLFKNFGLTGGFAQIDRNGCVLNGDRFRCGKQFFLAGTYKINKWIEVEAFGKRAVHNDFAIPHRTRIDVVVKFDLATALKLK